MTKRIVSCPEQTNKKGLKVLPECLHFVFVCPFPPLNESWVFKMIFGGTKTDFISPQQPVKDAGGVGGVWGVGLELAQALQSFCIKSWLLFYLHAFMSFFLLTRRN